MAISRPTGFKAWLTGYQGGTVPMDSPRRFDVANIIASGTLGTVRPRYHMLRSARPDTTL